MNNNGLDAFTDFAVKTFEKELSEGRRGIDPENLWQKIKKRAISIRHLIFGCPEKDLTEPNYPVRVCKVCQRVKTKNKKAKEILGISKNKGRESIKESA